MLHIKGKMCLKIALVQLILNYSDIYNFKVPNMNTYYSTSNLSNSLS